MIEVDGRILFCGSDVAKALVYRNIFDALIRRCKGIVKHDTLTNGGIQALSYISEGDVYRLVAHSKLPSAERFESWVFHEVLPIIRKTGGYVHNDETFIKTYLPFSVFSVYSHEACNLRCNIHIIAEIITLQLLDITFFQSIKFNVYISF